MSGDGDLEFMCCWEARRLLQQPGLLYRLEEILSFKQVLEILSSSLTRGGDDKGSRWEEGCSLACREQDDTLEP